MINIQVDQRKRSSSCNIFPNKLNSCDKFQICSTLILNTRIHSMLHIFNLLHQFSHIVFCKRFSVCLLHSDSFISGLSFFPQRRKKTFWAGVSQAPFDDWLRILKSHRKKTSLTIFFFLINKNGLPQVCKKSVLKSFHFELWAFCVPISHKHGARDDDQL